MPPRKSILADTKYNWMSKLSCKREDNLHEYGRATYIQNSVDSLSFEIDWTDTEGHNLPDSTSPQNFTSSFPMCTFVCKKPDAEMLPLFSTKAPTTPEDHTHKGHCSFLSSEGFQAGKTNLSSKANIPTEETRYELLSPNVQLLHEIHLQRGSTGTDEIVLSDDPRNWSDPKIKVDYSEFTIYRQRMRYEAIKKELFDDSTLETIDQETIGEIDYEYFYGDDYLATSNTLDEVGRQAVSFWSCIPNISTLFVPNLREGELVEDDSISEEDTPDASCSSNADEISDNCSNKQEPLPDMSEKSWDNSFQMEDSIRDEESSYSGSYMDQSHIYLMMTNARQERSEGKHIRLGQMTVKGNESSNLIDSRWDDSPFVSSTSPDSSHRWMWPFQKFFYASELRESETDFNQKRWLSSISKTLKGDTGPCNTLSNQSERCEAAKQALQRISEEKLRSCQPGVLQKAI